ncbi:MAG: bile acid:sodium symporter [Rhodobacteraceae bacterium]|nr:bile acid:sodium symporter [Paracoccaceae bacterium]
MTRESLERHQVWLYLAAIAAGLAAGTAAPRLAGPMDAALWPALAALLYATFTQVPLNHLPEAFRDARFMAAVLVANFALVPLLVWGLLPVVPQDPAVRLGVLLVLLVPCTDWFITFTHLARGDARRAIAVTPVNLLLQLALLPVWLWLLLGHSFAGILEPARLGLVFASLILAPLAAAWATEVLAERAGLRDRVTGRLGWLPVPLLALVVFLIAGSQAEAAAAALPVLGQVLLAFLLFLAGAFAIGAAVARAFGLAAAPARTLVFSVATRNSFVVLPFALALPPAWQAAVVVIVFQSLVELLGMIAFLRLVPRWIR